MNSLWNIRDFEPPPINTYKAQDFNIDLTHLKEVCEDGKRFFEQKEHFYAEAVFISKMIYRMKMKFRNAKDFKTLEKVNKMLEIYFNLKINNLFESFGDLLPDQYTKKDTYFPTKSMLDYILLRLQGASKLLVRIVETCKLAAEDQEKRMGQGHFWKNAMISFATLSRIFVLAKFSIQRICNIYIKLIPFSHKLKNVSKDIYEGCQLPKNLRDWLGVDWIDEVIEIIEIPEDPSRIMHFFDLVDSDEDVEFCNEYIDIKDDEADSDLEIISKKLVKKVNSYILNDFLDENSVIKIDDENSNVESDSEVETPRIGGLFAEEDIGEEILSVAPPKNNKSTNKKVSKKEQKNDAESQSQNSMIQNIDEEDDIIEASKNRLSKNKQKINVETDSKNSVFGSLFKEDDIRDKISNEAEEDSVEGNSDEDSTINKPNVSTNEVPKSNLEPQNSLFEEEDFAEKMNEDSKTEAILPSSNTSKSHIESKNSLIQEEYIVKEILNEDEIKEVKIPRSGGLFADEDIGEKILSVEPSKPIINKKKSKKEQINYMKSVPREDIGEDLNVKPLNSVFEEEKSSSELPSSLSTSKVSEKEQKLYIESQPNNSVFQGLYKENYITEVLRNGSPVNVLAPKPTENLDSLFGEENNGEKVLTSTSKNYTVSPRNIIAKSIKRFSIESDDESFKTQEIFDDEELKPIENLDSLFGEENNGEKVLTSTIKNYTVSPRNIIAKSIKRFSIESDDESFKTQEIFDDEEVKPIENLDSLFGEENNGEKVLPSTSKNDIVSPRNIIAKSIKRLSMESDGESFETQEIFDDDEVIELLSDDARKEINVSPNNLECTNKSTINLESKSEGPKIISNDILVIPNKLTPKKNEKIHIKSDITFIELDNLLTNNRKTLNKNSTEHVGILKDTHLSKNQKKIEKLMKKKEKSVQGNDVSSIPENHEVKSNLNQSIKSNKHMAKNKMCKSELTLPTNETMEKKLSKKRKTKKRRDRKAAAAVENINKKSFEKEEDEKGKKSSTKFQSEIQNTLEFMDQKIKVKNDNIKVKGSILGSEKLDKKAVIKSKLREKLKKKKINKRLFASDHKSFGNKTDESSNSDFEVLQIQKNSGIFTVEKLKDPELTPREVKIKNIVEMSLKKSKKLKYNLGKSSTIKDVDKSVTPTKKSKIEDSLGALPLKKSKKNKHHLETKSLAKNNKADTNFNPLKDVSKKRKIETSVEEVSFKKFKKIKYNPKKSAARNEELEESFTPSTNSFKKIKAKHKDKPKVIQVINIKNLNVFGEDVMDETKSHKKDKIIKKKKLKEIIEKTINITPVASKKIKNKNKKLKEIIEKTINDAPVVGKKIKSKINKSDKKSKKKKK